MYSIEKVEMLIYVKAKLCVIVIRKRKLQKLLVSKFVFCYLLLIHISAFSFEVPVVVFSLRRNDIQDLRNCFI